MATTRRAARQAATNLGDELGDLDLALASTTSNPAASGKQPAATRKKTTTRTMSKPLVVEDDVIVISSDSDDEPPAPPVRKPTTAKPKSQQSTNTVANPNREKALSQENERLKRQVDQLLGQQNKGKKRALDTDEDEEQDHERQRLRKKTMEMQAENERVKRKLEASEKEVKNLKTELQGKNVDVDGLRQHFECEICMETMWQPWALSDCGHTFCQMCLISLFNSNKFECPTCRVRVKHRPVEIFAFKSLIRAVAGTPPPEVDMLAEGGRVWDPLWAPQAAAQVQGLHVPVLVPAQGHPHAHAHAHAHAHPRRR
ncbi:hypothetical protein AURDEDRAFT_114942 [Auricularia subglabra TFB-10046 SS5]|nr:hypothetical protein AURDEDRAFT_114942 [Auricularia subglabra TFB-10046 SS5]